MHGPAESRTVDEREECRSTRLNYLTPYRVRSRRSGVCVSPVALVPSTHSASPMSELWKALTGRGPPRDLKHQPLENRAHRAHNCDRRLAAPVEPQYEAPPAAEEEEEAAAEAEPAPASAPKHASSRKAADLGKFLSE